jgi:hypothetical protein
MRAGNPRTPAQAPVESRRPAAAPLPTPIFGSQAGRSAVQPSTPSREPHGRAGARYPFGERRLPLRWGRCEDSHGLGIALRSQAVAHGHRSVLPLRGHSPTYRTYTAHGLSGRPTALIFAADEPRVVRAEVEPESAAHVAAGQQVTAQEDGADGDGAAGVGLVLAAPGGLSGAGALRRRPGRGVRDRPGRRPPSPEDRPAGAGGRQPGGPVTGGARRDDAQSRRLTST